MSYTCGCVIKLKVRDVVKYQDKYSGAVIVYDNVDKTMSVLNLMTLYDIATETQTMLTDIDYENESLTIKEINTWLTKNTLQN